MTNGEPPKGQLADQWPCYVIPEGTGRFWKPWKFERNIPPHGDSAMLYRWIGSNNSQGEQFLLCNMHAIII